LHDDHCCTENARLSKIQDFITGYIVLRWLRKEKFSD